MCGIVGYIGKRNAIPILIDSLKRLEYRGYDSAGIAYIEDKRIDVQRCEGKIKKLESCIKSKNLSSTAGIGHTRWATHGRPSERNAHPHRSGGIVVVHNGIIENYYELREELKGRGFIFTSETDTEVVCHLINSYTKEGLDIVKATKESLRRIEGAYALGIISEDEPDRIIAVKKDSPLVLGLGKNEFFIASDIPAFLKYTRDVIILENNELAVITNDGISIEGVSAESFKERVTKITWSPSMAEKGGYRHFMLKEIHEQPQAITDTIRGRVSIEEGSVNLAEFSFSEKELKKLNKVFLVACGTSWHAALVGKYMIEDLARIPCEVDIASEFRYREPVLPSNSLITVITQSGETADTLAAQREAKKRGAKVLSICNVIGSTSSREADGVFYTHSGPEIGVASTKAFTTQLTALYFFAIALARAKKSISKKTARELLKEALLLPEKVEQVLKLEDSILKIAKKICNVSDFLYLGRGVNYPIALEGALKMKEISYIHAEGYPAGEMKHGPIALIDKDMPVLALVPGRGEKIYEKILSNIEEAKSRRGKVIAIAVKGDEKAMRNSSHIIFIPATNRYLSTILFAIPLQLLAYHTAVLRKCNVDQPRNLAKSVTVE